MKKFLLFLSVACVGFTSCNKDDDNNGVDSAFLTDGTWIEITPQAQQRSLSFDTNVATLSRQDGTTMRFTYSVSANTLFFTASTTTMPMEHSIRKINSNTIEVGNIAIGPTEELVDPQTVTFRKYPFTLDNYNPNIIN